MDIMHKRLVELLEQRGAATDLAKYLGVHPNTVGGWKSTLSKGYNKYLPQIAEYFDVSLEWLSGRSDDRNEHKKAHPQNEDELNALLVNSLKELSPAEVLSALAFVEKIKSNRKG